MRTAEKICLERHILASVLFCEYSYTSGEIYYEARGGLELNLFSGIRVRIAEAINKDLAAGENFETIRAFLTAKSQDDKALRDELSEVFATNTLIWADSYNAVIRQIEAIIAIQNIQRGKL